LYARSVIATSPQVDVLIAGGGGGGEGGGEEGGGDDHALKTYKRGLER
jgi:hypothetical protein